MIVLYDKDYVIVDKVGKLVENGIVYASHRLSVKEILKYNEITLHKGEQLVSCTTISESEQEVLVKQLKKVLGEKVEAVYT